MSRMVSTIPDAQHASLLVAMWKGVNPCQFLSHAVGMTSSRCMSVSTAVLLPLMTARWSGVSWVEFRVAQSEGPPRAARRALMVSPLPPMAAMCRGV